MLCLTHKWILFASTKICKEASIWTGADEGMSGEKGSFRKKQHMVQAFSECLLCVKHCSGYCRNKDEKNAF